jgi:hypothetical protein
MIWRRSSLALAVGWAILAAGCRPSMAPPPAPTPVRGKVVFANGQPLRGGVVTFNPVGETLDRRYQGWGFVRPDGSYEVVSMGSGVAPGLYKVTVGPKDEGELRGSNARQIPKKYNSAETTPLSCEVSAEGEFVFDIRLN